MEVFVGRVDELALIASLHAHERVGAVVVVGDPGVGKSRLLEAAAAGGDQTLRVAGFESSRPVPLAAAADLLRLLVSVPVHGRLLDELVFRSSSTGDSLRVFEAAHRALAAAWPDPLLLVDDLQWVDDLSLALVHYLARAAHATGRPLRLVAAGRRSERTLAFADELTRLLGSAAEAIDLGPFGEEESRALVLALDPALGRERSVEVCARAAGSPFWIEALVRTRGAVDERRLLATRLRDADDDVAALLELLAVAARPLSDEVACELLGWSLPRLLAAAEGLVARGVAVRTGARLAMAHDLLREAAYAELPERARRGLHARVAAWLVEAAGEDLSLLREALEHRAAAGEQPLELALRVAGSPQRHRLGVAGLATLAAVADRADLVEEDGQRLRACVVSLAVEVGEHAFALERGASLAAASTDEAVRFEALLGASKGAFELGATYASRAHELVAAAAAAAASEEQAVAARAHEARILLWLEHRTEAGVAAAGEALERSRALAPGPVRLQALATAREALIQQNDGERILALAGELLSAATGREDVYAEALLVRADGEARTGPLGAAEASARRAFAQASGAALPVKAMEAAYLLSHTLHDQGRLDEAADAAATARGFGERLQAARPARLVAEEVALVRGEPSLGEAVDGYLAELRRIDDPHPRVYPGYVLATFLARARGPSARSELASLLDELEEDAAAARCPRCAYCLQVAAAEALARVGFDSEAEAHLAQAETTPTRDALNAFLLLRAQAALAALRDPAKGGAQLERVCREAERLERFLDLVWAQVDLARALSDADRQRAAELLRTAAASAEAMGAVVPQLVAEQELRRLGVRTWRRRAGSAAAGELTEREREIAALVARGASNPEIAKTLFLSRKTVERHVSNVLAKLGARNRAELAALLSREGEGAPR